MENQESKIMTFQEFLEKIPPGREVEVTGAYEQPKIPAPPLAGPGHYIPSRVKRDIWLSKPQINLYCDGECKGIRPFNTFLDNDKVKLDDESKNYKFIFYNCKACEKYIKAFAISILPLKNSSRVFKFGEQPWFSPPTPPRLITLIRDDKELFIKGLRSENQGLGIGAFAYYRRVVENQKNRIFDEIIRAANKIAPGAPIINELEDAKKEKQFDNAVKKIRNALPESLQIYGENPLNLLHTALSKGLHNDNDDECLELAGCIRRVLFEFIDKLGQALEDKAQLYADVNKLIKFREKIET